MMLSGDWDRAGGLSRLELPSREETLLMSSGFDTLEKIAAATSSDDLGLGRRRGDTIQERARRMLAHDNIRAISLSSDLVRIGLNGTSQGIVESVKHVLAARYSDLKIELQGKEFTIFRRKPEPCSVCGKDPAYWCKRCGSFLCSECRGKHYMHPEVMELRWLEDQFTRVTMEAGKYEPKHREPELEYTVPNAEIVSFARGLGLSGFVGDFFSEIKGNEVMKKALGCALFSTPEEPVHVLVVGDPAGGKTLARDAIARRLGREVELVGANTTRAGLVVNLATGDKGVLAYSDRKVVLVDEFDKIPERDIEYCYELLSNGKCTVHSAKVHETIESSFIMIGFANPTGKVFGKRPIDEVPVSPILASRFAFIVRVEELGPELVREVVRRKLTGEGSPGEEFSRRYQSWLEQARRYQPKLTASSEAVESYVDRIYEVYERFLKTPLRRDLRMADYAKRVAVAMARAGFSDVDDGVLVQAMGLIDEGLKTWIKSP
jgi:MoxR-like ATPase